MTKFGLEKSEKRIDGKIERVWFGCTLKNNLIPENQEIFKP